MPTRRCPGRRSPSDRRPRVIAGLSGRGACPAGLFSLSARPRRRSAHRPVRATCTYEKPMIDASIPTNRIQRSSPALIRAGQQTMPGTRYEPSQFVFFPLRNQVLTPSGHSLKWGPLSAVAMTIVSSVIFSSSRRSRSCPTCLSCSTMPSAQIPRPVTPRRSGLRWVKKCIREVFTHVIQGLPARVLRRMNDFARSGNSSSTVSIRLRSRGEPMDSGFTCRRRVSTADRSAR